MLIQLVASGRGIAALPDWVVKDYEQKGWVVSRRFPFAEKGQQDKGLRRTLYAAYRQQDIKQAFIEGFLNQLKIFSRQRG